MHRWSAGNCNNQPPDETRHPPSPSLCLSWQKMAHFNGFVWKVQCLIPRKVLRPEFIGCCESELKNHSTTFHSLNLPRREKATHLSNTDYKINTTENVNTHHWMNLEPLSESTLLKHAKACAGPSEQNTGHWTEKEKFVGLMIVCLLRIHSNRHSDTRPRMFGTSLVLPYKDTNRSQVGIPQEVEECQCIPGQNIRAEWHMLCQTHD